MYQIAQALPEYAHYFTPFYVDGFLALLNKLKLLEFTIIGDKRAGQSDIFPLDLILASVI